MTSQTSEITTITMPQLGESVHEATISKWLVKPGDRVEEFEPMLEVDTDKVSAEVPSPVTGILHKILAEEGQTVEAGAEIATVVAEEVPGATQASPAEATTVTKEPETASNNAPSATPPLTSSLRGAGGEHRLSPAVLMLAQEHNLNLEQVQGSGIGGRITKKDLRQLIERQASSRPTLPRTAAASSTPPQGEESTVDQRVPLNRVRRLIAENMVQSKTTIPHAWQTQEVDMSGVVANRAANKRAFAEREGFSLTYL
ncbi:MAG: biotin/lipoyl-containing protein, partial [Candidatus Dormibacteraceae bacterium]